MTNDTARSIKFRRRLPLQPVLLVIATAASSVFSDTAIAQSRNNDLAIVRRDVSRDILTEKEWQEVEAATDRGLAYLSSQHRKNGSFQANIRWEPGISGLCVMAFLSRGHVPEQGPYGDKLRQSVDFILGCQQPSGLFSPAPVGIDPAHPTEKPLALDHSSIDDSKSAAYNHGIGALVISELFGLSRPTNEARFREAIERAVEFTSHRHVQPKRHPDEDGSWRYLHRHKNSDGDLSVTSWNVIFLRSARNSGFNVEGKLIDEALAYMKRLYDPQVKSFGYQLHKTDTHYTNFSRAMAGAGVLSLALSGDHHSEFAQNAADYILDHPFDQYVRGIPGEHYPCYAAFYSSQAMFMMGGNYWSEFYPKLVKTLIRAQRQDGSWLPAQSHESSYGASYTTALTVMALTPPYQILPIFQR